MYVTALAVVQAATPASRQGTRDVSDRRISGARHAENCTQNILASMLQHSILPRLPAA